MKPLYKYLILHVLVSGVMFALFYAAMDYRELKPFDFWQFLFRSLVFGIGMGLITWWTNEYSLKRDEKKKVNGQ